MRVGFFNLFGSFQTYTLRWKRFFCHLIFPILPQLSILKPKSIQDYFLDTIFYFGDIVCIPEFFIIINWLIKPKMRTLSQDETMILQQFYADKIKLTPILIDPTASFVTKKWKIAYVSFNLINYWQSLIDFILVHEIMHVYQFQKYGSVYIYRALKAQRSQEGYDYGGISGLVDAKENGKSIHDFNFEQQASIIEHYYLILNDEEHRQNHHLIELYKYFWKQL